MSPVLASKIGKVLMDFVAAQIQLKIQSKECRTVLVIADAVRSLISLPTQNH